MNIGPPLTPKRGTWGLGSRLDEKTKKSSEAEAIGVYNAGDPGCHTGNPGLYENGVPLREQAIEAPIGAVVEAEKEAPVKDENKPEKTNKAKRHPSPGGIAHHPRSFDKAGGDVIFTGTGSTNYNITGTTDGGDALLTNVEVTVIFWGDYLEQYGSGAECLR
jgi:hypothetical protein